MSDPDLEPSVPHGAHGRALTRAEKWAAYKDSPYFPATVMLFILAAAAGLIAGSYTYAMATTRATSGSSRTRCSEPGRWSPARCSGCGATGTREAVTTCLSMRPRPPDPGPGYSSLIRMSRYETTSVVLWTWSPM